MPLTRRQKKFLEATSDQETPNLEKSIVQNEPNSESSSSEDSHVESVSESEETAPAKKVYRKKNKQKNYEKKSKSKAGRPKLGPNQCDRCAMKFRSSFELKQHSRYHWRDRGLRCWLRNDKGIRCKKYIITDNTEIQKNKKL